ncbi:MAG: c-type cytochrome [Candidatus Obscuribacterales bacterium]|nr:c-type cytochrome [Candidatus Obscuribacterales bacterium]
MKLTKLLPTIPIIALLTSCAQTEVKLPSDDQSMVSESQTNAPTDYVQFPDDRPSIPDGKVVWEKMNCAQCHGVDGAGTSSPVHLNDTAWMSEKKPVDMYKFLTYGGPNHHLALQTKLSNREIWNVVFYTRSLAIKPSTQADLDEILPVFGANCAVCHGTKGDGDGPLARNLEPWPANFQTFRRFYDRTDNTLFDHIANGIKWEGMPNFLGKEDKKKGVKFDHAYIKRLVQFVRNFHVSNEPTIVAASETVAPAAEKAKDAADKELK